MASALDTVGPTLRTDGALDSLGWGEVCPPQHPLLPIPFHLAPFLLFLLRTLLQTKCPRGQDETQGKSGFPSVAISSPLL